MTINDVNEINQLFVNFTNIWKTYKIKAKSFIVEWTDIYGNTYIAKTIDELTEQLYTALKKGGNDYDKQ